MQTRFNRRTARFHPNVFATHSEDLIAATEHTMSIGK
jgi:hypothetical protein